ncbi:MAG: aminopeptidase P family N-terminal domain-containing protein [Acetobacteraceae bacterium]|nr:aminopeptidase P family N-terminal domain-containing protein [Acetobacteraceae bacterium]
MNVTSATAEPIAAAEFASRIEVVRRGIERAGLAALIAFGDCWRGANISYFTEFRPLDGVSDIANAVFLLGIDSDPVLLVSDQCLDYARSVTHFDVRSLRELTDTIRKLARRGGTAGLAGSAYVPATVLDRIRAGLGEAPLEPTQLLAETRPSKATRRCVG